MSVELDRFPFGTSSSGAAVEMFTFTHTSGLVLSVINYGCIIQSLQVADNNGNTADIALGYDTLAEYEADQKFLGCVIGRYANRIANGKCSIEGVEYLFEKNASGHHIHGGSDGFHKQVWQPTIERCDGLPVLALQHCSKHGDGGYPGTLNCKVTYKVTKSGEIVVSYHATTDRPTIANLTNHSYFNLAGHEHATENGVLDHQLQLCCNEFLPADGTGIPLSDPITVDGTPMDFRTGVTAGDRINNPDQQLINGNGYDHTWVVEHVGSGASVVADVTDPVSGRCLQVATTQPGIQVYTSNYVENLSGKGGVVYQRRGSICLETQHYPDSPNRDSFPSTLYTPDRPLCEMTVFRPGCKSFD